MRARVAVVGASGRVGSAICLHLRPTYEVVEVCRQDGESVEILAARATTDVDLVINAAGMAHVEHLTPIDLERLQAANVELPTALAESALRQEIPMIHISSVKARRDAPTPYGRSKFEADRLLDTRFGERFASVGQGLVVIRPLALLLPPFDAGKLKYLRFLRWWPATLTPPIRLPVLATSTFLTAVEATIDNLAYPSQPRGFTVRGFERFERGSLRDILTAMRSSPANG